MNIITKLSLKVISLKKVFYIYDINKKVMSLLTDLVAI